MKKIEDIMNMPESMKGNIIESMIKFEDEYFNYLKKTEYGYLFLETEFDNLRGTNDQNEDADQQKNPREKIKKFAKRTNMLECIEDYSIYFYDLINDIDVMKYLLYIYTILEYKLEQENKENPEDEIKLIEFMLYIKYLLSLKINMSKIERLYHENKEKFDESLNFLEPVHSRTLKRIINKTSILYKYVPYEFSTSYDDDVNSVEAIYKIEKIYIDAKFGYINRHISSEIAHYFGFMKTFRKMYEKNGSCFGEKLDEEFYILRSKYKAALPVIYFNIISRVLIETYLEYLQIEKKIKFDREHGVKYKIYKIVA